VLCVSCCVCVSKYANKVKQMERDYTNIFTRGAAGTRQEIFQNACLNDYAAPNKCCPMIFMDSKFWHDSGMRAIAECVRDWIMLLNQTSGVYPLVTKTAGDKPYKDWLLCTDNKDEIVEFLKQFRKERGLPVLDKSDFKGRGVEKMKKIE